MYWIYYNPNEQKNHLADSLQKGTARRCSFCSDPIIPGDKVGVIFITEDGKTKEIFVHAENVLKMASPQFCPSQAKAVAYWNGVELVPLVISKKRSV